MKKALMIMVLLWLLMEPEDTRVPSSPKWLKPVERRKIWRQSIQKDTPGCKTFIGDWRTVLETLLVRGCVEQHPGPVEEQGKMTRWSWENLQWAFDYAVVTRGRMGENHFDEVGKTLVKLFRPGSPGSIQTVQLVAKIMCAGSNLEEFRDELGSAVPSEATVVNDEIRVNTLRNSLERLVPKGTRTDKDYLAKVVKVKDESWLSFVERFYASAHMFSDIPKLEKVRLFYSRLNKELRDVVAQLSTDSDLDELVDAVTQKLRWEQILHVEVGSRGGGSGPGQGAEWGEPMEIDQLHSSEMFTEESCNSLRDKLVDPTNQKLIHSAITSDNGVMCAWKILMKNRGYRQEAENFLRTSNASMRNGNPSDWSKRRVGKTWKAMMMQEGDGLEEDSSENEEINEGMLAHHHSIWMREEEEEQTPQEEFLDAQEEWCDSELPLETRHVSPVNSVVCRTVTAIHPSSVTVPVAVNGVKAQALVDTGASHNFVQYSLLKKFQKDHYIVPCGKTVTYGNGLKEPLMGQVSLQLQVDGVPHTLNCYVIKGKGPQIILGYTFLSSNKLLVDCYRKALYKQTTEGRVVKCSLMQTEYDHKVHHLQIQLEEIQSQIHQLMKKNFQG